MIPTKDLYKQILRFIDLYQPINKDDLCKLASCKINVASKLILRLEKNGEIQVKKNMVTRL